MTEPNRDASQDRALLRRIRALRTDAALRDAEGVFIAEGIHLAREGLAAGAAIEVAVIAKSLEATREGTELRSRLAASGAKLIEVAPRVLDALQDARAPQPVLVVVRRRTFTLDDGLAPARGIALVVVACDVKDPGNLGTILRTALAAGASAAIATGNGADLFHPRCVRATAGAVYRLPAVRADAEPALAALERRGIALVAADAAAGHRYDSHDFRGPTAILLGGEGAGLPPAVLAHATVRVRIPMQGAVESLSVGAAAAVLLFEAARQRARVSASSPTRSE